jgi:hypothetical protein
MWWEENSRRDGKKWDEMQLKKKKNIFNFNKGCWKMYCKKKIKIKRSFFKTKKLNNIKYI